MKKERIYIALLLLSVSLYVSVEILKPKPVNWSDDFAKEKVIPYASKILYEELDVLFPNVEIVENLDNIYLFKNEFSYPKNWIFINSGFQFDKLETELLLDQISSGDQVFIAGLISGFLADSLNLKYDVYYALFDSTFLKDSISVGIKSPLLGINEQWKHDADASFNYFTSYDTLITKELGTWENGLANFIEIDIGEGKLFLNSTPYLFTNYFLRNPDKATYAFTALSHFPIQTTIWDEYYKAGKAVAGTPLYVILSTQSLKQAWYLALFTLFLFMIFRAKRLQRIIPMVEIPKNSTLLFTETIGMLYLEQGTHKQILDKKIQFFFDYIKTHLRLDISEIDERFKIDLAFRSGIPRNEILKLFDLLDLTKNSAKVSVNELKTVTDSIDQFYKNTQR